MADPRITFNSINIDLKIGKTGLKQKPVQKSFRNEWKVRGKKAN